MENLIGRYRNVNILAIVIVIQILGLAVQVKRSTENQSSRLIRVWAVTAVTPLEKLIVSAQSSENTLKHNREEVNVKVTDGDAVSEKTTPQSRASSSLSWRKRERKAGGPITCRVYATRSPMACWFNLYRDILASTAVRGCQALLAVLVRWQRLG